MENEYDKESDNVNAELDRIGLPYHDTYLPNYSKDEKGNVYYLETFKPWQNSIYDPSQLICLFNEADLRKAINALAGATEKEKCNSYLDRLLVLYEEEKRELQNKQ